MEIVNQINVKTTISNGLINNSLSHSLLFHGPPSTGKLTTALALAKILNCENQNYKACHHCRSCKKIDHFSHPDLILINTDPVLHKLDILLRVLEISPNIAILHQYLYYIRDLLYRLRSQFFSLKATYNRVKKSQDQLFELSAEIEEILMDYTIDNPLLPVEEIINAKSLKTFQEIHKNLGLIYNFLQLNNIPIETIRRIMGFLHKKPMEGKVKTLIINGIEHMKIETANTFLKSIEEPPPHNQLILITENYETILPTIKSRCFNLGFKNLSPAEIHEIFYRKYNISLSSEKIVKSSIRENICILDYLVESGEQEEIQKLINSFLTDVLEHYKRPFKLSDYVQKVISSDMDIQKYFHALTDFLSIAKRLKYGILPEAGLPYPHHYIHLFAAIPEYAINDLYEWITRIHYTMVHNNVNVEFGLTSILLKMAAMTEKAKVG